MQTICRPIGIETGGQEKVFHDVLLVPTTQAAMQDQCMLTVSKLARRFQTHAPDPACTVMFLAII